MFPGSAISITRRSGTSFARGTTIDEYLSAEDNAALYKIWKTTWPEPFKFSGNVTAITCEMVLDVPEAEFATAFGKKDRAQVGRILAIAKRNAGR